MVKTIRFTVSPEGQIAVNVEGATGAECERMTRDFEAALGTVVQREYKDSYYATDVETLSEETKVDS